VRLVIRPSKAVIVEATRLLPDVIRLLTDERPRPAELAAFVDRGDGFAEPVGHVEVLAVAADVKAVRAEPGGDGPGDGEGVTVNQPHAGGLTVALTAAA